MSREPYRVVLTGASGGLGQAFALALCEHSTAMVLVGRDRERLRALEQRILERYRGMTVRTIAGDLTAPTTLDAVVEAARALRGGANLLINAAGVSEFHGFETQSAEAIEHIVAVNLVAPIRLTQRLLPLLLTTRFAQVVNVGSIFGYLGYPGFALYCATKFGLRGFSQALRRELGSSNVAVRYFAPRAARTPLNSPAVSALNRALKTREDEPERVAAKLVRFLAGSGWERKLGFPERLYVFLNHLVPGVNDRAIRGQLALVRRHLGETSTSATEPEERKDR